MNYAKDGITVSPVLDVAHPKKSGKFPVKIRVTYKRIRCYYSTGKDLTPEEWEALPTTKARMLASVRKDIESSYQIVRVAVEELATAGQFTIERLNIRLKGAASNTVNAAFRVKMEVLREAQQVGNMLIYDNVLKGLERFAGSRIRFESITVSWLEKYALFLRGEGKTQTTIAIHLRTLRAILNIAKQQGIIREAQYPFGRGLGQYHITIYKPERGGKWPSRSNKSDKLLASMMGGRQQQSSAIIGFFSICATESTWPILCG